jgi:hypothetical protein
MVWNIIKITVSEIPVPILVSNFVFHSGGCRETAVLKLCVGPGMVHIYNPRRLRQEDLEFQANLGYTVRPCLKTVAKIW